MKIIITILSFTLFATAQSQNASPYWSITGNNNETGTSKLGTTNKISLHFYTNNSQRMYIDSSSGNVGIGTAIPITKLHVVGSGSFGNRVTTGNATRALNLADTAAVMRILRVDGSNAPAVELISRTSADGNNVAYWDMYAQPSDASFRIRDRQSTVNDRLVITHGTGNIGMGTAVPVYKLEVKGDIAIDSGVFRITGDPVLKYNTPNQSIALGNAGGTGTRLNTAIGYNALISNTTGQDNVAVGHKALYSDNSGYSNIALGSHALYSNTTGNQSIAIGDSALFNYNSPTYYPNMALGSKALFNSTTGYDNTAVGFQAMYNTTTGGDNTAIGHALYSNTTGNVNVGIGYNALGYNTTGYDNVAYGNAAVIYNSTGDDNTGLGVLTLANNITGSNNTGVGYAANVNADGYTNATALGYFATATASNEVMLGNTSVTAVEGYAPYYNVSDGRVKKNIKENVPGLSFINALRPVTYNYDVHAINDKTGITALQNKNTKAGDGPSTATSSAVGKTSAPYKTNEDAITTKEKKMYTGFVAQEVETAAGKLNYDFSGIHRPQNDKDLYALSYSDFVVPLVKAVQELSRQNDSLKNNTSSQQAQIDNLQNQINQLKTLMAGSGSAGPLPSLTTKTVALSSAAILQNVPNPFTNSTTIQYSLPSGYSNAMIVITDKTGKTLKTVVLNGSYSGTLHVEASTLASGAYQYALIVDGSLVDTKQMVRMK